MTVTMDIGTGIVVSMVEVAGTFGLQVRKMWLILTKNVLCKFYPKGSGELLERICWAVFTLKTAFIYV